MTQPLPIRAIVPAEAAAFIAVLGEAFTSSGSVEQALAYELLTLDFDRTAAAFDGDTIAGTSSAFGFRLPVPGATADCAGITNVAVLPAYRRRGIMSAMITDLLRDSLVRGEPIAALFASESGIYGRFGFGCASEHLTFTIKRGEGRLLPLASLSAGQPPGTGASPSSAVPAVQPADPEKDLAELAAVYAGIAASRPGLFHRDDRWWRARTHDPESEREGTSALRCVIARDDAGPRGYALYRTRPNWGEDGIPAAQLMITELMAADPQATVALWTDLLTRDLVGEVTARLRPVDDPLLHLLADRRRARAQLSDGLWIRLNDVPAALAQRRYACDVDVVIEVADPVPANAGRFRLQASLGGASTCERTSSAPDVVATVQVLGAAYLGGARLTSYAAAGQLTEERPGALAALSAAMAWDPAPWCPMIF